MAPKSSVPCRRGLSCPYYARGCCYFLHKVENKAKPSPESKEFSHLHPEQKEIHEQYMRDKEKLAKYSEENRKRREELKRVEDGVLSLRQALRKAENDCASLMRDAGFAGREEVRQQQELNMLHRRLTTCPEGLYCRYYDTREKNIVSEGKYVARKSSCTLFHTKEQIAVFEAKEKECIDALNEDLRVQEEKKAYEADKVRYHYKYCALGYSLKKGFSCNMPDEICGLIRDYCAQREFKQNSPLQHFYGTFNREPVTLLPCTCGCFYCRKPVCSLCHGLLDVYGKHVYLLQTKSENKVLAHFLHGSCVDVLGFAHADDSIADYLKGDLKVYENDEVRLHRSPNDLCLDERHVYREGRAMGLPVPPLEEESEEQRSNEGDEEQRSNEGDEEQRSDGE